MKHLTLTIIVAAVLAATALVSSSCKKQQATNAAEHTKVASALSAIPKAAADDDTLSGLEKTEPPACLDDEAQAAIRTLQHNGVNVYADPEIRALDAELRVKGRAKLVEELRPKIVASYRAVLAELDWPIVEEPVRGKDVYQLEDRAVAKPAN